MPDIRFESEESINVGAAQVAIAVRRNKSEQNLSLASELSRLQFVIGDTQLAAQIQRAVSDITSVTRAAAVEFVAGIDPSFIPLTVEGAGIVAAIAI